MRTDGASDVAERVDRGAPNGLLVRFEELKQLEANAHPLTRRDHLGAALGDASHQLDAVLLYLLVPIAVITIRHITNRYASK